MFEPIPQFSEPNADAVRLRVSEQDSRTVVECSWPGRAKPHALHEARVTVSEEEVTVERRRTPPDGTRTPWVLIDRSDAGDLARGLPMPISAPLRLTAALMIVLSERALDANAQA